MLLLLSVFDSSDDSWFSFIALFVLFLVSIFWLMLLLCNNTVLVHGTWNLLSGTVHFRHSQSLSVLCAPIAGARSDPNGNVALSTINTAKQACWQAHHDRRSIPPSKLALRGYVELLQSSWHSHSSDLPTRHGTRRHDRFASWLVSPIPPWLDGKCGGKPGVQCRALLSTSIWMGGCSVTKPVALLPSRRSWIVWREAQVTLLPLARWVALFYLAAWHRIIRNHQNYNCNPAAAAAAGTSTSRSKIARDDSGHHGHSSSSKYAKQY